MKKLLIALLVLVVLAGAGLVLLLGSLGSLIKRGVETVGSEATQAPVTLSSVDFSATEGRGELHDLVVGNPDGFATDHALRFGTIRVVVDPSTIGSDPVIVKEVVIEEPQITYEVGTGRTNIGTIQENVEAFAKRLGAGGGGSGGASEEGSDDGTKVVIEDLYVRRGRIGVSATFLGGRDVSAELGEIHLKNIGKGEGGATAGEIAAEVLGAITSGTIGAVGDLGIEGLGEGLIDRGRKAVGGALEGLFGK